ncbi:hypothetical protein T235_05035 [Tannerella sp. oral taxon BU063 isolate Cell 8/11]|uniref:IgA Peptidase M64 n=1 Tax=Tannerella sp. oral taxon BU063 isolate Cell 8/11 TaxID=1411915 RepID=W2D380_9BACT|nr:hypothetical protein T235_05035 [Tannerella sp. oral taxon BU063 isolate Cell 8/11]
MTKRFHLSHLLPALWLLFALFACEKPEEITNKPNRPNQGQTVTPSNPNQTEDLSKVDVVVTTLQKATIGKGYNIVLMGIGFPEDYVREGHYEKLMEQSYKYLFSVEPMNSLRPYFNVYAVRTKVQDTLLYAYIRDFSGQEYQQSKHASTAHRRALAMASSISGFTKDNSVISVIVNTKVFLGLTYMTDQVLAYAYSALSSSSTHFRGIILHETVGHGIGKLADEYSILSSCGSKDYIAEGHKKNWYMNISLTNDPEKVPWAQFLKDKRYVTEDIGIYEGGGGCFKEGVWRSAKGGDDTPIGFNAPSRRAIYDHVMQVTTGRTPTYEEFVQFDLAHRK